MNYIQMNKLIRLYNDIPFPDCTIITLTAFTQQKDKEKPDKETSEEADIKVSCDDFIESKQISKEFKVDAGESFDIAGIIDRGVTNTGAPVFLYQLLLIQLLFCLNTVSSV